MGVWRTRIESQVPIFFYNSPEKSKKEKNIIIDTHADFFWNHVFTRAFDWEFVTKLQPDLYVTVIDRASNIRARLRKEKQWKAQGPQHQQQ